MGQVNFKLYRYRWIILFSFMIILAINQLLWITFAPITSDAASYYGVSDFSIAFLSMIFMIVYIVISIPASWVIDTYGFRVGVGIGAVLTGLFGLTRGLLATNYTAVLISQIGIALGQPFIMNALTKVAARWFPIHERATASGLGFLAMYIGIAIGMMLTPFLVDSSNINNMLLLYGGVSVAAALVFLGLSKERPPTPPCPPGQEGRSLVLDGLKEILRRRDFILLMIVFFIYLGAFNGVTTWIEQILTPRAFTPTEAGLAGGLMIIGGIVGAFVMPLLSDRYRKRVLFLIIGSGVSIIGLVGITCATTYWLVLAAAFIFGFFLLSAGPIGFQYGAEIAYPAPEGTSNGLLLLAGQIGGIGCIIGMDVFKSPTTGSMSASLFVLIGLMVLGTLLCTRLKESSLIRGNTDD